MCIRDRTSAAQFLNPVLATTPVDDDVVRLVFSGLTRYQSDGSIENDLAASFTTSDDGKVWTFQIREDARWHDGKPVISDDVVYTVALLQDKAYVGPYSDAFRGVKVDRITDRVVRFTLPDAYGPFASGKVNRTTRSVMRSTFTPRNASLYGPT